MTTEFKPKDFWRDMKRPNRSTRIPHGYKISEDDILVLVPDMEKIPYFEQAMDALDAGESLRNVAAWLNEQPIGKPISHMGVKVIWRRHRGTDDNPRIKQLNTAKKKNLPKTFYEKRTREIQLSKAAARRALTVRTKQLESITQHVKQKELAKNPPSFSLVPERDANEPLEVAFKPNPGPQTDFLAAPEREVLYGGAAGGGKSYALLADVLRYAGNENFNGLLIRRTNDELRELITKASMLYGKTYPGTKFNAKASTFTFPSGAKLWMAYLDNDRDVERYQGQAFCWIGFDELTHYPTPMAWDYLRSRLRTTDQSLPLCMRATTNPGGPGHGWVKRMFIDPAPPNTAFPARDIEKDEVLVYSDNYRLEHLRGKPLFYRRFIPAKLSDNPYLYEDGQYEANLMSMHEMRRRQLLEGDWAIAEGAAFPEFQAKHHVIEPYEIPSSWKKFRSCDYGYASYSAVHWYAIDPVYDTLIVYRELYTSKKTGKELANMILALEKDEKILYGILDSSVWHQRGNTGPSIAEEMIGEGCRWRPADRSANSRINGRNRLHEELKIRDLGEDSNGIPIKKPGIQFFNTCRQIIADLPVIPTDPDGGEDIDNRYASDHTYDSIRYGIMSRPPKSTLFDFGFGSVDVYVPADKMLGY